MRRYRKPIKEVYVKETSTITSATCKFTLENLRILMLLRAMSYNNYIPDIACSIPLKAYSQLFNISEEQTLVDFIKAMEELKTLEITPKGKSSFTGWILSYEFIEGNAIFYWNPKVEELESEGKSYYICKLDYLKGMTSVLSLQLYRYLSPYIFFKKHCNYTESLVDILGIENFTGKPAELKELLLPVIEEINKNTLLTVHSITKTNKGLSFSLGKKLYVKK